MIAVLHGVFAATCWALVDLIARNYATRFGPYRMGMWTMLLGGIMLTLYFAIAGWPAVDSKGVVMALITGIAFGVGIGALFRAFSLGPISIVGPLTEGYPVLVVFWGLTSGLRPTWLQWLALPLIFGGGYVVARFAVNEGAANHIREGDFGKLLFYCGICWLGYAAAMILGQTSAVMIGETETTWISRATAALVLLPFMFTERGQAIRGAVQWTAVAIMALLDCLAVIAVAGAGHLEGKEFAVVAAATYGAIGVGLAALVLKEKVNLRQWGGVALIILGVAALAYPA
ncbi:hypothetical protein BH10PSE7_BH10PSE7_21240 [soil metagenome]